MILTPNKVTHNCKLTDAAIRKAAPKAKQYKLSDGAGLVLVVTPNGGKWWRFRYRFPAGGPQKDLSLGTYPQVPLIGRMDRGVNGTWIDGARDLRDRMRRQLAEGIDPGEKRKADERERAAERANTFEGLWNEWLQHKKTGGHWGEASQSKATFYFRRDLLPKYRNRSLKSLQRTELAELIKEIDARAPEAADKIRGWLNSMFDYAIALGRMTENPADKLIAITVKKKRSTPYAHLPFGQLSGLLFAIDGYGGSALVKIAARLLVVTGLRPGEVRRGLWAEVDFKRNVWVIPAQRMKMRREHTVPLPRQAVSLLKELQVISGKRDLMFPSRDDSNVPMSDNSLSSMFRRLGYNGKQTGHGFRHLISTELNERGYDADDVERQLAHGDEDKVRGTYNHSQLIERRRTMMQEWTDCIDDELTRHRTTSVAA